MRTVQRTPGSVQAMRQVLSYLMTERQQLRAHGATAAEVEANRRAIVAMEWQLGHALGESIPVADRGGRPSRANARNRE
jgi:hypothetical protein